MATKSAIVIEQLEATATEPTIQQKINEGITRVIEATGVDVQKARYKAMRAIAFQAFTEAIVDGSFDQLVEDAISNADDLPSGWVLGRAAQAETAA
jgi:hypothetical protein